MLPESLQAKLDPYRTVFKSTDEVLYLVRISGEPLIPGEPLQGIVELVTEGTARLLGRAPEEFLKNQGLWNSLIHPEDVAGVVKSAQEMFARRQADTWVYRLRHHPSGEYRWVEDHVVPIGDDNGKLLGICGLIRDITAQKQIECRLHHQTAELESLLDNMPDGLLVADDSGRILRANAALENMLGYSRSELESLTIEDLVPARYREGHAQQRAGYTAHPRTRRMEGPLTLRALRKDGGEVPVGIMLSYIRAAEGNRVMAIIRDVTLLRLAQQSLMESEERYRRIVETAEEGVCVIDASACTTYVNSKMASMLGYTAAEMLGRPVFDFVADEDRASVGQKLESCRSGVRAQVDLRFRRQDSTDLWTIASATPLFDDGSYAGCFAMITDITDRKKLEAQLAQAGRLESVGRLAAGVAHDFNNLLTVINGYSDLALTKLASNDPLRAYLQDIRKAGGHAQELTKQLLAFSRNQFAQPRVVSLNDVLNDCRELLRRLIGEQIDLRISADAPSALVKVEPDKIRQVILNMAANARDAMPHGGVLTMETARQTLGPAEARQIPDALPGKYVLLRVTDTGQGMDEGTRQHIFEPFFTTKESHGGTGLGLATVYGILKQSNGYVTVQSETGLGTSFQLYLPEAEAVEVASPPASRAPSPRGSETILVVEDHAQVRQIITASLERYGYTVLEAAGGKEALEICQMLSEPLSLVVTDVVMPGMTGPELGQEIRRLYPGMKILYVSGYTGDKSAQAQAGPGIGYLQKPFDPEELAAKVGELLDVLRSAGNILIVDDDPTIRTMFGHILQEAGYQVREAGDGRQAIQALRQAAADLAVMDLFMPEQEGLETIRQMRKEFPQVKIIAVSGAFDDTFLEVADRLGAEATLPKPVSPQTLVDTVRQALGH